MDCSSAVSSVHGILQVRTGAGCHSLLQTSPRAQLFPPTGWTVVPGRLLLAAFSYGSLCSTPGWSAVSLVATSTVQLPNPLNCSPPRSPLFQNKKKNTLRPGILQALLQIESVPSNRVVYNFPLSLSRTWRLLYRSWEQGQQSASPE